MSTVVGHKGPEASKTQSFGSMTRKVTRIIVVSSDTLLRAGLRAILGAVPEYRPIVEASTMAQLHRRSRKGRPELALVDVSAGLPDGLEELGQGSPLSKLWHFRLTMIRRCSGDV